MSESNRIEYSHSRFYARPHAGHQTLPSPSRKQRRLNVAAPGPDLEAFTLKIRYPIISPVDSPRHAQNHWGGENYKMAPHSHYSAMTTPLPQPASPSFSRSLSGISDVELLDDIVSSFVDDLFDDQGDDQGDDQEEARLFDHNGPCPKDSAPWSLLVRPEHFE